MKQKGKEIASAIVGFIPEKISTIFGKKSNKNSGEAGVNLKNEDIVDEIHDLKKTEKGKSMKNEKSRNKTEIKIKTNELRIAFLREQPPKTKKKEKVKIRKKIHKIEDKNIKLRKKIEKYKAKV